MQFGLLPTLCRQALDTRRFLNRILMRLILHQLPLTHHLSLFGFAKALASNLPILKLRLKLEAALEALGRGTLQMRSFVQQKASMRSEEHTSELQSPMY